MKMFRNLGMEDMAQKFIYKYNSETNTNTVYRVKMTVIHKDTEEEKVYKAIMVDLTKICEDDKDFENYFFGEGEGEGIDLVNIDRWWFTPEELEMAMSCFDSVELNMDIILKGETFYED